MSAQLELPLCLRFVNTVGDAHHGEGEVLHRWQDLLEWAVGAGGLGNEIDPRRIRRHAEDHARAAERGLSRALEVRACLFEVIAAAVRQVRPEEKSLEQFNHLVVAAFLNGVVKPGADGGFVWSYPAGSGTLDDLLAPIVRSAVELLTSDLLGRIRICDNESCTWLFIDRSRAGRRRWCDMASCGNRAKAKRHYARRKAASNTAGTRVS